MEKKLFIVFSLFLLSTNFVFAVGFSFVNDPFRQMLNAITSPSQQASFNTQPTSPTNNIFNLVPKSFQDYINNNLKGLAPLQIQPTTPEQTTPQSPTSATNPIMDFKSNPDMIKATQQFLNQNYGTNLNVDGIIGKQTQDAIKKFEADNNLPITSDITKDTPATQKALEQLDNQMSQPSQTQSSEQTQNLKNLECSNNECLGGGTVAIFGTELNGARDKTSGGTNGRCPGVILNYGDDQQKNLKTPCVAAISKKNFDKLGDKVACNSIAEITIRNKTYKVPLGDSGTSPGFSIEMSGSCYREYKIPADNPKATKIVIKQK